VTTDPRIGTLLVGHRIEGLLGRGGMGVVYKAEHLGLGRKVALKVLVPELAGSEAFRQRFIRESRMAASIEHPNIIPIYEAGEAEELLYISMRYVPGPDLGALIDREGRLGPERTVAITYQVADALDAAHRLGLVHRDVKPGNILIASGRGTGSTDHCYLCDFGLIKHFDSQHDVTSTGQFVGTIPYVAPEQIEGRQLDGRTDVYALGCVLFQCLTGAVPFERETDVAVVYAHLQEPPPSPHALRSDLPAGLDRVFDKALAKSRDERYATCGELVADVRVALQAKVRTRPGWSGEAGSPLRAQAGVPPPPPAATRPAASPAGWNAATRQRPADDPTTVAPAPPGRPERRGSSRPRPAGGAPRRRRRRVLRPLLGVLATVGLAAALGFAAARLMGDGRAKGDAGDGSTDARATSGCVRGWTEPKVGTPERRAPLDTIRRVMSVSGSFNVVEMRRFEGPGGLPWWYVKAWKTDEPGFRGRWLVAQGGDGTRRVAAVAPYESTGLESPDWQAFDGEGSRKVHAGLPGSWAGSPHDFVAAPAAAGGGLPPSVRGCLAGT
jgi:hypothetical protein